MVEQPTPEPPKEIRVEFTDVKLGPGAVTLLAFMGAIPRNQG
jgi:hypothetical protein